MKRNELIETLKDAVEKKYTEVDVPKGYYSYILQILEKEGMLPPARKLDHEEYKAIRSYGTEVRLEFYTWDKE